MHHSSSLSEIRYLRKSTLSLGKIRDKNLSRLKLKKRRVMVDRVTIMRLHPRYFHGWFFHDLILSALPSSSTKIRWGWSWTEATVHPSSGTDCPLWLLYMSDTYGSIRALVWEHVFSICCSDRIIPFFFHISIDIKLTKNYCKKRIVRIVIFYQIYI